LLQATPTFFYNNCFKNGILPAILKDSDIDEVFSDRSNSYVYARSGFAEPDDHRQTGLGAYVRDCTIAQGSLLKGLDDIGTSLQLAGRLDGLRKKLTVPRRPCTRRLT